MTDRVAHAAAVTARLRDDEPPLGLDGIEAICPQCCMAYVVSDRTHDWGVCRDCFADGIRTKLRPL